MVPKRVQKGYLGGEPQIDITTVFVCNNQPESVVLHMVAPLQMAIRRILPPPDQPPQIIPDGGLGPPDGVWGHLAPFLGHYQDYNILHHHYEGIIYVVH